MPNGSTRKTAFAAIATAAFAAASAARADTFTALTTLSEPAAIGAVQGGVLYGTSTSGGSSGEGEVFTITPSIAGGKTTYKYAPLYDFSGSDGANPNSRLIVDGLGNVFGTAQNGGNQGAGTVFAISAKGRLLWSHSLQPTTEGGIPLDGLAADAYGNFFGTTSRDAISPGNGVLFRVNSSGAFHVVYLFRSTSIDGHCPFTGVVVDRSETIYGTTVGFGFGGQPEGAIWKRPNGGKPTTQHSFTDGTDGEWPQVTPTLDTAGNLWGVSYVQNASDFAGAIWKLSATGFNVVYSFTGGADGYQPDAPLLLGRNGYLYGTTANGGSGSGSSGDGVVYKISTTGGAPTVVHTFTHGTDGAFPAGGLAMDSSGNIYGGTATGSVFQITP